MCFVELCEGDTASGGRTPSSEHASKGARHKRKFSQSRFDETASTVVTRVPNKSVEDLYCLDTSPKGSGMQYSQSSSASEMSMGAGEGHESSHGLERPHTTPDLAGLKGAGVCDRLFF